MSGDLINKLSNGATLNVWIPYMKEKRSESGYLVAFPSFEDALLAKPQYGPCMQISIPMPDISCYFLDSYVAEYETNYCTLTGKGEFMALNNLSDHANIPPEIKEATTNGMTERAREVQCHLYYRIRIRCTEKVVPYIMR